MYKEIERENEVLKIIACCKYRTTLQTPQTKMMTKPEMDKTR